MGVGEDTKGWFGSLLAAFFKHTTHDTSLFWPIESAEDLPETADSGPALFDFKTRSYH